MHPASLIFTAAACVWAAPAQAQDASGLWTGAIAGSLTVHLEFRQSAPGSWEGTLTVPQQGHRDTVDRLLVTPGHISFQMLELNASFAARWDASQQAWIGSWTQGGQSAALVLKRADPESLKPKRPQEEAIAAAPAPYTSAETVFRNEQASVTLAATLTVPHGRGPFPAVVLVQGSGPLNRNSRVFGHDLLLVLADHLTRQGIAVLRYDKRGIGASTGSFEGATTADLASDAEAAVRFLRGRAEVDQRHIGMVGHSEGGIIAPMVAARDAALDFIVLLAAPGVSGAQLLTEQIALASASEGMAPAQVAQERALHEAMLGALASDADLAAATAKAQAVVDKAIGEGRYPATMDRKRLARFSGAWMHGLLRHDPIPVLRAVRQPVLALNGGLDRQVPAALDLPPIRAALQANPGAVVKELPGLNHMFQRAVSGSRDEYFKIEQTIDPVALLAVSDWIVATVRRPGVK